MENERIGVNLVVVAWRSFGKRFGEAGLNSACCSLAAQRAEPKAGSCHSRASAGPEVELVDVTYALCFRSCDLVDGIEAGLATANQHCEDQKRANGSDLDSKASADGT